MVVTMHIDEQIITSSSGAKHKRILLRESYREGKKVKKRTLCNLSKLPAHIIDVIRSMTGKRARGKKPVVVSSDEIKCKVGLKFGSLFALYTCIKRTGILDALGKGSNAMIIVWLICARILFQGSRLKATRMARMYCTKTVLGLDDITEDQCYHAMDWLSDRQQEIEDILIRKDTNKTKGVFLYDVTSFYLEGQDNELGEYGHNRDKKKGRKQIVVGLLTDAEGNPLSIEVFPGNTSDPKTCSKKIEDIKKRYSAGFLTLVGDRGMIREPQIEKLMSHGWNYLTAITKPQIRKLLKEGVLQPRLFDEEIQEVIEGNVRYVVRRNPVRAAEMMRSRADKLSKLREKAQQRTEYLAGHTKAKEQTALKYLQSYATKLQIDQWAKVTAHNRALTIDVDDTILKEQSSLDGCYVIKTNITDSSLLTAKQAHDRYKDLALVEWAFRSLKTTMLQHRPIYHRKEMRTRAACFISMLAYKVVRDIINQLSGNTDELLRLLFKTTSEVSHQALPLEDILADLDRIQQTSLQINNYEIPIIQTPSDLGEKVLSILNIQLPTLKSSPVSTT